MDKIDLKDEAQLLMSANKLMSHIQRTNGRWTLLNDLLVSFAVSDAVRNYHIDIEKQRNMPANKIKLTDVIPPLNVRVINALRYRGKDEKSIITLGDLITLTEKELWLISGIGNNALIEIHSMLLKYKLKLKE